MTDRADKPLSGITVVDFSQFLSGPYAGLRLADLGARVVKIENPRGGDLCRRLYISNVEIEGDSSLFHAINRNKESFCVDLKNEKERLPLVRLLEKADVVIQNFRPGVIERLGFGYEAVRRINPRLVYGSISGYGTEGPLAAMPGQDLLVQSLSGLARLGVRDLGERDGDDPLAYGLAVADMSAGALLAEGILAALVRRGVSGRGALVETSLLEATLDLMGAEIAGRLAATSTAEPDLDAAEKSGPEPADAFAQRSPRGPSPVRTEERGGSVPAGIYRTKDGYLAIGRGAPLSGLLRLIGPMETEEQAAGGKEAEEQAAGEADGAIRPGRSEPERPGWRDSVRSRLQARLAARTTAEWLGVLEREGVPCAEALDWPSLLRHDGFRVLDMLQTVRRPGGTAYAALRCPIRMDGRRLTSAAGSPRIGEHNEAIRRELESM